MSYIFDSLKKSERERAAVDHPLSISMSSPAFLDNDKSDRSGMIVFLSILLGLCLVIYVLFTMIKKEWPQSAIVAPAVSSDHAVIAKGDQQPQVITKQKVLAAVEDVTLSQAKREAIALYEQAIQEKTQLRVDSLYDNLGTKTEGIKRSNPPQKRASTPESLDSGQKHIDENQTVAAEKSEVVIPSIYDLDRFVKKNIPSISYGAHIYASDNESGFVILNGARRRAGDELDNGVYVEKIAEASVVLSYEGTIFSLPAMKSWVEEQ